MVEGTSANHRKVGHSATVAGGAALHERTIMIV